MPNRRRGTLMADQLLNPDDRRRLASQMIEDLRRDPAASGLELGEVAPEFTLPDATGAEVRLRDRLDHGPAVVVFYRGAWCPHCDLHLRGLEAALGDIRARGASLIAISPQAPDASLSLTDKLSLEFDLLSDLDQSVSQRWRLQFELPAELHDTYRSMGMALDEHNADGSWRIPIPATFVLDDGGVVRARHVDPNYRERMDPADVVAALDDVGARSA
jgi:peroxiredoxin